jgi:hypothetical protein
MPDLPERTSMPPTISLTLDRPTYDQGATVTVTVAYDTPDVSAGVATVTVSLEGVGSGLSTVALSRPDPLASIGVGDDSGRTWTASANGQSWTATADRTCTVIASLTTQSGAKAQATAPLTVNPPPPPPVTTRYGASMHNAADFPRLAKLGLNVQAVRVFCDLPPASWNSHPVLKACPAGCAVVVSFRSGTVAQMQGFFDSRPPGLDVYGTWLHEPEDNVEKGQITLQAYRDKQAEWAPAFREVGVTPAMILMGYTLSAKTRKPSDYFVPDAHDIVCFDAYNSSQNATPPGYNDPVKLVDRAADWAASVGRPWGITEAGSPIVGSPDARAAWAAQYARRVAERGGKLCIWWDAMGTKDPANPFDARLDGPTASVWHA